MVRQGKILVATDFSEQSQEALRKAMKLAHAFEGDIYLLHVMEPFMMYDMDNMMSVPVDDISEVRRKGAHEQLEKQAESVRNGVTIYPRIVEDMRSPSKAICEEAKDMNADMIVIGRHGSGGFLEHLLIGSTVERVVRHAPCTVIVSHPHAVDEEES
ncbi:MAG TPA: universal stress protein [Mariprofundaceae bacterium]|nr:universal stress protein [Mariprofundaceae bacterium]